MARRVYRIAGQGPKVEWKRNKRGAQRSIHDGVAIALRHGVQIPNDVIFVVAAAAELTGNLKCLFADGIMETARGPEVAEHSDGYVYWKDHYNRNGRIPFRIHPEVLTSDEAIVAVFQHEMFELAQLREVFRASRWRRMDAGDYGHQVSAGYPGNFHEQA